MIAGLRLGSRTSELTRVLRSTSYIMAILAPLLFGVLSGCAQAEPPKQSAEQSTPTVSRQYLAADVAANEKIQLPAWTNGPFQAGYEFALAHPEMLEYIPCYCGCATTSNHKNNLDCYIKGVDDKGTVIFDNHAVSCGICLAITTDVKRLNGEGKSLAEIRSYIDDRYSRMGPGTDTPLPPPLRSAN